MKILIIKQLFYPEPTARSLDFALELVKNGHEVQILTGFPSYPEGKIYKGYKQKIYKKEKIQGIEVIRVPIFPDQSNRAFKRFLNYMSFAISSSVIGLWIVNKADVAFAYHGALPVGIPAIILKFFRKVPFVYDINDLWPDTLSATGMLSSKWILRIIEKWCHFTYKFSDHITVLSNGFKTKLIKSGVPKNKITVIHHWSRDVEIEESIIPKRIKVLFPDFSFNILYAGNVGIAQSLESIIIAIDLLNKENYKVNFTILGDGVEKKNLLKFTQVNDLKGIHFLDRVSSSEVGKYLASADLLLVHLKDEPLFKITIPSKIIGYLFSAKPILLGVKGDAEKIIEDSKAGWTFRPDDQADLVEKIKHIYNLPKPELTTAGKNGLEYYKKHFTISKNTKKYIHVFQKTCEK